jgi:dUTP pyrophosphatase
MSETKLLIYSELDFYKTHTYFNEGDAGIDLIFPNDITIKAGETKLIDLQLKTQMIDIKTNKYISYLLIPRSSIYKTPLRMSNSFGLIDSGYTGNIKVAVDNIKNEDYIIKSNQRLFQIINASCKSISLENVSSLRITQRGNNGFGSTN